MRNRNTASRPGEAAHGSPPPSLELLVAGKSYARDDFTNVTPRMLSHLGRNLHLRPQHPLGSVLVHTLKIIFEEGKGTKMLTRKKNSQSINHAFQFFSVLFCSDNRSELANSLKHTRTSRACALTTESSFTFLS